MKPIRIRILSVFMAALCLIACLPAHTHMYIYAAEDTADYVVMTGGGSLDSLIDVCAGLGVVPYAEWGRGIAVSLTEKQAAALGALPCVYDIHTEYCFELLGAEYAGIALLEDEDEDAPRVYPPYDKITYDSADGYSGQGMAVAVIDSGFTVKSDWWALSDPKSASLTAEKVSELSEELKGSGKYLNAKFPWVCDYTDGDSDVSGTSVHGNCVASVIGANGPAAGLPFAGVVPEAQLLLMKVMADSSSDYVAESSIASALYDARLLGADAVNISLGSAAGFSDGWPMVNAVTEEINLTLEAGIAVICAAGNESFIGYGTAADNAAGIALPRADVTDYGTISTPASIDGVIAVGAFSSPLTVSECITAASGREIGYSDSCKRYFESESFTVLLGDGDYEYVAVGGLGTKDDYAAAGDLTGKIALVSRGEITFVEKVNNAAEAGAAAVIVINNKPEELNSQIKMELTGAEIPAILITAADGEYLTNAADKRVTVKVGHAVLIVNQRVSPYSDSSRGVTPQMTLKPEISAAGIDVYSLSDGEEFVLMSGTSIAAPFITGASVKYMQYARAKGLDDSPAAVRAALMNAASPASTAAGAEYSPRWQGAGFLETGRVIPCAEYGLSLAAADGSGVLSLGDKLPADGVINLTFDVINNSTVSRTVNLTVPVLADELTAADVNDETQWFISGASVPLSGAVVNYGSSTANLNTHSGKPGTAQLTLPASSKTEVTLRLRIGSAAAAERRDKMPHGFFVDGYIICAPADNSADSGSADRSVSIPYFGFVGDWNAAPALDASVYGSGKPVYDGVYLYSTISGRKYVILGYGEVDDGSYDAALNAFSPGVDGNCDSVHLGIDLLRPLSYLQVTVTDPDGNTVLMSDARDPMRKNITLEGRIKNYSFEIWDGGAEDNSRFIFPDGDYTMTIRAIPASYGIRLADGDDPAELFTDDMYETLSIPFVLDTAPPKLESYKIERDEDSGLYTLTAEVSDNHALRFAELDWSPSLSEFSADPEQFAGTETVSDDGGRSCTVIFEDKAFSALPARGYIYLKLTDYAYNTNIIRIYCGDKQ